LVAAGIVAAGVISIPSTLAALPAATPSPTTMTVTVRDDPHHVALGDAITYTIVASNNGDTENTDFLLVVSWEPETEFDSFIAPPGWTVNLPGSIPGAPFALSTFNDPMSLPANSSVTFTLVLTPQAAGQFEMAATLFSMLPNQTQSTEIERTPVTAAHGH
jgi:uncharacterized repeat protein (TIGR01451 family)